MSYGPGSHYIFMALIRSLRTMKHRHAKRARVIFCDSIRRTVYSNDLVKFFGCDIQQERNWEFMMYIPCYIGNGKIAK